MPIISFSIARAERRRARQLLRVLRSDGYSGGGHISRGPLRLPVPIHLCDVCAATTRRAQRRGRERTNTRAALSLSLSVWRSAPCVAAEEFVLLIDFARSDFKFYRRVSLGASEELK